MTIAKINIQDGFVPWNTVVEIANTVPKEKWVLVGGLMTQAHAMIAGYSSRTTKDVDVLIDVLASSSNVSAIIKAFLSMGFDFKEPGLRGSPFHRMLRDDVIVDVLIADHLPKSRSKATKVKSWNMMEIAGGAQAVQRKMDVELVQDGKSSIIQMPNLLGALILKSAAYCSDNRDKQRHLDDVALLASFIADHKACLDELHGSDKKRLRAVAKALSDPENSAWKLLDDKAQKRGLMTLAILSD